MECAPSTHPSLLARLRDPADAPAWAEFLEIYQPLILRLACRRGLQLADAQDLCQEVLCAVAQKVEDWNPDGGVGKFRAWLYVVARNLALKMLARNRSQARGVGGSDAHALLEAQPDTSEDNSDALDFRREAFHLAAERVQHDVAPSTWKAFWLTTMEDVPVQQAAEQLQMTPGAVYVARCRVAARVRAVVETIDAADTSERSPGGPDGR